MLYREIIAVCSEIHTKHINTLCGQNVELLNVKPDGTYSGHWIKNDSTCPPTHKAFPRHTHQTNRSLFTISRSQQQCGLFPVTNFSQHVSLFPYTSMLDSKHNTRVFAKFGGVPSHAVEKSGCAMDRAWRHMTGLLWQRQRSFWFYKRRTEKFLSSYVTSREILCSHTAVQLQAHRNGLHCTGLLAVKRPSEQMLWHFSGTDQHCIAKCLVSWLLSAVR